MRLQLDGTTLRADRPTIKSALDAARTAAQARGRVIVEARIDGHAMGDEELTAPDDRELPNASLEFVSADPGSLVRVTLLELAPMLEEARARQQAAAEFVGTGDLATAFESLSRAFEIWNGVQQAVANGSELLGLELDSVAVQLPSGPTTLAECVRTLAQGLGEIKRALSVQDLPGLSDALLYDMDVQTHAWDAALKALADRAAPPTSRS
ncbi:MAG: hypothetical protein KF768_13900 [Phycisphaeraceae bacterium]|nr:hypothetical protein [Phycisphaeraceae bacterium]